jgi:hypothetical protein
MARGLGEAAPDSRRWRLGAFEAVAAAGVASLVISLFVSWWSRPADVGETTPLTWLPPATNIRLPLYVTLGSTIVMLLLKAVARPSRWLWFVPLLSAIAALLTAVVELGYLEVYDDAQAGMAFGLAGLVATAFASAGLLASRGRSRR